MEGSMSGIWRPALSGHVDASASRAVWQKFFDPPACSVGELALSDSDYDLMAFAAPGVSRGK